jgi:hypothetical protein
VAHIPRLQHRDTQASATLREEKTQEQRKEKKRKEEKEKGKVVEKAHKILFGSRVVFFFDPFNIQSACLRIDWLHRESASRDAWNLKPK